jgi:hypothetical protein
MVANGLGETKLESNSRTASAILEFDEFFWREGDTNKLAKSLPIRTYILIMYILH